MNAFSIIFLIEPFMYYKILTAQTGHALHVLKTLLYNIACSTLAKRSPISDKVYTVTAISD